MVKHRDMTDPAQQYFEHIVQLKRDLYAATRLMGVLTLKDMWYVLINEEYHRVKEILERR